MEDLNQVARNGNFLNGDDDDGNYEDDKKNGNSVNKTSIPKQLKFSIGI